MGKDETVEVSDAEQLGFCKRFLENLFRSKKHKDIVRMFYYPPGVSPQSRVNDFKLIYFVAWASMDKPPYPQLGIPMDLSTIEAKFNENQYQTAGAFREDMHTITRNVYVSSPPGTPIYLAAIGLSKLFSKSWEALPKSTSIRRKRGRMSEAAEVGGRRRSARLLSQQGAATQAVG